EELDAEIQHHLEMEVERLVREGMTGEEARREALRLFGPVAPVRETAREEAGFRWLEQTWRDLRISARGLRRAPGFTLASVLTLGLGIGATTAIYSIVDNVLLDPLPYPESHELVRVFQQNRPDNRWSLSVVDFEAILERETVFERVAAMRGGTAAITGRGRPERVLAGWVTADWFGTFGIEPRQGRAFTLDEDIPGRPRTVVLSAAYRDRLFGSDEEALGESIVIDGEPHTVIGILGPEHASIAGWTVDLWPILRLGTPGRRGPFGLRTYARLDARATIEDGRRDLARISDEIFPLWADGFSDATARLTPYPVREIVLGDVGRALWLLMGAVAGVLLICVANVANLQLVRAAGRDREMSLRTSLGASRARLARQLLTESALLSASGGLLGVVVAVATLRGLVLANPSLPRVSEIGLDGGVLLFAALVSVGTGILFGLAPLVHALSSDDRGLGGGRGESRSVSPGWGRMRSALVTAEFALALPILAGAGLMITSLERLGSVDPGFSPEGLISARVALPSSTYPANEDLYAFWDEARRRIEEVPGVEAAGISTGLPLAFDASTNNFDLVDRPVTPGDAEHVTPWNWTGAGFLEAVGVPLLEGRLIESTDGEGPPAIVVSRSWADRFYPDETVLGREVYAGGDHTTPMTVVGVVADVKVGGLDASDDAAVYEPYTQAGFRSVNLLVRAEGPVAGIVDGVRAAIASLDPDLPLSNVKTMEENLADALSTPRYWTRLLTLFATLGLVLAAIGVYGVLSYYVSRQRKMLGIRVALGAPPRSVRRLVVARGMRRAVVGVVLGLAGSFVVARWLGSLLYDVSATDARTLAIAAASLTVVAFVACYLPARRATKIDPLESLRAE
ncbi:MAG: ABC transporter permease, partial [Gemmatimonadota bacterium]|nr:ABC transporter permease [Gemmatimonadota bacterium]